MYLITRIAPFGIAVVSGAWLSLALVYPQRFLPMVSAGVLTIVVLTMWLVRRATVSEIGSFSATVITLIVGVSASLFFVPSLWMRIGFVVGASVMLWVYGEELYRYIHEPRRYHRHSIERLTTMMAVVGMATAFAGVFALRIFLDVRLIFLLPGTFVLAMVITLAALSAESFHPARMLSTTALVAVLVSEMSLVVHFLPTTYWVSSLIVTIPFYVSLSLIRLELSGSLSRMLARRLLTIGGGSLAAVLVTAQWTI